MTDIEMDIFEYLKENHMGHENAVHSCDLAYLFDMNDRNVRRHISSLRKSGVPVCSDVNGYWIAASQYELNKTIKRLGDFISEVGNAKTGLAFANVKMSDISPVAEKRIEITVRMK